MTTRSVAFRLTTVVELSFVDEIASLSALQYLIKKWKLVNLDETNLKMKRTIFSNGYYLNKKQRKY